MTLPSADFTNDTKFMANLIGYLSHFGCTDSGISTTIQEVGEALVDASYEQEYVIGVLIAALIYSEKNEMDWQDTFHTLGQNLIALSQIPIHFGKNMEFKEAET